MSKTKTKTQKVQPTEEVSIDLSTEEDNITTNGDIKIDEPLHWDSLLTERNNVVRDILTQQAMLIELSKKYRDILLEDNDTAHIINGLVSSIQDLAENVAEITKQHQGEDGKFFTGLADDDDAILDYLRIASTYISIEENLANLITTGYAEVFTRLTTNGNLIKDITDLKELANAKQK
jgi:hypothetical protein